ncbi:MAG TPA: crosslink repair DNA glycosylase YcaQ family protein [Thermomicrobiaceae bacterium]|nr:crosslink repair DNA glycosylase YcaQ family protein [Thermomicrobiaceae bacterium]
MIELSRAEARALAVMAQQLDQPRRQPATKQDVAELIRRLGCVQIDTIAVVARSQYLVLWSRLGHYDPAWLDELHYPDRQLFEYWAHAASIIPLELYPYFRSRMLGYAERARNFHADWSQENDEVFEHIRERIRRQGAISSSDFDKPAGAGPVEPWSWYGGKPTNRALEILWSTGELGILRRVNFQRHYHFADHLYPEHHQAELPSQEQEQRALALTAAQAMGVVAPRWLNDYFRTRWGVRGYGGPKPEELLSGLADAGELIPVEVEAIGGAYVARANQPLLEAVGRGARPTRTTLLSPFDNLIWDRARIEELFDFEYRLECYTPAPKRKYGYYTMPILHRGELVGRLEPKVDRRTRVFSVRSLHLEPGVALDEPLASALDAVLAEFASFNGAESVDLAGAPRLAEMVATSGNGR